MRRIYKDGDFHLLSACNGRLDLFDRNINGENVIADIIVSHEKSTTSIILDCACRLTREVCSLNSYC